MTTIRKTIVTLSCVGLLSSLAACSESPENTADPSSSTTTTAPSSTNETPSMTASSPPSESSGVPASPSSAEPGESDEPASTNEIPSAIQGRWVTVGEEEKPKECTEELEAEGAIITINATKISSFAFLFELESIQESDANSMVGRFAYHDDGDQLVTPRMKLETQDDWQTLELIELDTEGQDPDMYARCS